MENWIGHRLGLHEWVTETIMGSTAGTRSIWSGPVGTRFSDGSEERPWDNLGLEGQPCRR